MALYWVMMVVGSLMMVCLLATVISYEMGKSIFVLLGKVTRLLFYPIAVLTVILLVITVIEVVVSGTAYLF